MLFHGRGEQGRLGDLAIVDVELVDCFGSPKWSAIRESALQMSSVCFQLLSQLSRHHSLSSSMTQ